MTGSLGSHKGDFACDFGTTNLQATLYTKMQRTYPKDNIAVGSTSHPSWPFGESSVHFKEDIRALTALALRVEQTVAGGQNIPSCKSSSGEIVTDSIKSQDAGTLCSCLYKNWTPKR